jgi:DNA modification methylase
VSEVRSRLREKRLCPRCSADLTRPGATRPGVVFDPFVGTGTTGEAALTHGRNFLGCDIRASQIALTNKRLACVTPPLFAGSAGTDR